jgi:alkylhydroperoxidase/carboxymuconolactone decarboxylase family protein YurZ
VLRLGVGERGVTEIMAVSEHVSSLCAGAAALQLAPDVPERQGPPPAGVGEPPPGAGAACLDEVLGWSGGHLGLDRVPDFWRLLAHQPRFLEATWAKDRLVMGPGRLDQQSKRCVALAVAASRQSPYWIAFLTHLLRRNGLGDRALVELTASVMHYVSFNTVAHGMMLRAQHEEMTAADFEEPRG